MFYETLTAPPFDLLFRARRRAVQNCSGPIVKAGSLCFGILLLASPFSSHAQSVLPQPPIEHFFENPAFSSVKLSPDAKLLAVRVGKPGKREGLAVIDLQTNKGEAVAYFEDADIGHFEWVNDHRLAFDTTDKNLGQGDVKYAGGLFAVNSDGTEMRELVSRQRSTQAVLTRVKRDLLPWYTSMHAQKGTQDSEFIYVDSPKPSGLGKTAGVVDLQRLNTLTGKVQTVPRPLPAQGWILDQKGEPRVTLTYDKDMATVYYIEPGSGEWRKLRSFNIYTGGRDSIQPLAFGPDGTFYVLNNGGGDKAAVYTYDLAANTVSDKPVIATAGYDFTGGLITDKNKVLGLHFLTDAESTLWFDEKMKTIQDAVDAALPATVNIISVAQRAATPWVLVESYSDMQPRSFQLYNTETKLINKIGDSYPNIVATQMGRQEAIRYKARDGLEIPAWLTLPKGKRKDLPLVVLVHGGPYVRGGSWGWKPDLQFLASRGYAVLEPEFRGSTGFGDAHNRAGWKQWGLAMQDDITDGVRWAVEQGIVDPKRVCIAGASYGGYAALMGLIKDPELYQCAIDWVGVTDIKLLFTGDWTGRSDLGDTWKDYGMPKMIGDLVKDAAQLTATSPLEQAARVKKPVLMAYGGADERVPLYHGRKFHEALKGTNSDVEYVVYPEEGHGWALPKNRIDFWTRVEKFLDRNIGKKP